MGFEIKYIYHNRKEDGGYDTENKEEKFIKVGKPFDDTILEKAAASIMAHLARRDIWVIDVEVAELVRKPISFKECKDGKGITLKGKRYAFNCASQMVSEDVSEETELVIPPGVQPHEFAAIQKQNQSSMERDSNGSVTLKNSTVPSIQINQKIVVFKVIFDPPIQYVNEIKRLGLRFTIDNEYPVHKVIQHSTGKLELQKIAVTNDVGKVVTVDEKFFTTLGTGLLADKQLNFSGSTVRSTIRKPKLMFEDQMVMETSDPKIDSNIRLDNDIIPENLMVIPDIRSRR